MLELLLVLFIMGLLTVSAVVMTEGVEDQSRYEETKRRMILVKRAIAGDPARTVNGQPDLGGFVADIGRPPNNLQEFLEQGTLPAFAQDATSGLWAGWRGPYLDVLAESGGSKAFRDGYLNPGSAPNYGWSYGVDVSGNVALSSVGANTTDAGDDIYDGALLTSADYTLPLSAVKVTLHNRRGTDSEARTDLKLRIYAPVDGGVGSDDSAPFSVGALSAVQSAQVTASFSPELDVPMGTRAYVVICSGTGRLYDGDCDAGNAAPASDNAMLFTVVPRAQPTAFEWVLQ